MSSRGDSGYMSNYSSIYSQKSENSFDSYRDSYDDSNGMDYADNKSSSPTSPSYYSDQRDENIENFGNNRNYKKKNTLRPPSPNPNPQYQYSTSPNNPQYQYFNSSNNPQYQYFNSPTTSPITTSPTSYDSDQNEHSPTESNKRYPPLNSPYSLPSSPRYGPGPPIKMPIHQFNKNHVQGNSLSIPRRDTSLRSNPQQFPFPSLPRSPKIQSYPPQVESPITSEVNNNNLPFSKSLKIPLAEYQKTSEINNNVQQYPFPILPRSQPSSPQVRSPTTPEIDNNQTESVKSSNTPEINNSQTESVKSPKTLEINNSQTEPKTPEINNDQTEPDQVADFFETHDIIDSYYDDIDDSEPVKPVPTTESMNKNREAAINEILTTERTYVDGLKKLVNVYLLPLRENNQRSTNKILSTRPIATNEEMSALFGNIEQLLTLHEQLLKSLEERSSTQHISDIFLQSAPYLKMYIIYLKNFPQAISTMERLNKESKDFKKFLQQCQLKPELGGLSFNSFLSLPIQRIPRYKLLMEALLKYTEDSAPDYKNLQNCVDQTSAIAEEVNERIRDAENQQKVLEIQGKVTGLPNNLVDPARRFILKGNLYKVTPSKLKPFFYVTSQDERDERAHFLFNDLLLFCLDFQGIYHYKGEIDLRQAKVVNIDDDFADRPHCFQIITREGTHTVRAKNNEEKVEWMTKLEETIWSLQNGRLASNMDGKQRKRLIPIRQNAHV